MIAELLLLVLILLATLAYLFYKNTYNHWTMKGIPQASAPVPVFGNILDFILKKKSIGMVYDDMYRKFSNHDVVGFYEFHIPKLLVRSPDLIQKILASEFSSFRDNWLSASSQLSPQLESHAFLQNGDKWKPARTLLTSGLTSNKVKEMYPYMMDSVPMLDNYLEERLGEEVEALELGSLFMMTNTSNCVFGIESNCFVDKNSPFKKMQELMCKEVWQGWLQVLILFFLPTLRDKLGYRLVPNVLCNFVENMVRQVAEAKINNKDKRKDYFQHYLSRKDKTDEQNIKDITGLGLTFFISGMETSSIPGGNTLYELALNQDVQDKLFEELHDNFQSKSDLKMEIIEGLPYLNKVVHETLRKYPTLYAMTKDCSKEITLEIDGKPFITEVGTHMIIPVYSIHRDPLHYPEPERFDPERFTEENIASRAPYTFLSFGEGPRICPGQNFGLSQIKLFVANIIYKFKVLPTGNTPKQLEFSPTAYFVDYISKEWIKFVRRDKKD